jgi:glycerophosphoryl diester phosphodiesterase
LIVAHRGSSGVAPENTLAAFRQAVDDGADMIELDVRMTKDFELVVLHDRTVQRTTDGRGNIWSMTHAELRDLDAGSWFNKKFAEERIPTLRQVFDILPPSIQINIEAKTDGKRRRLSAFEKSLVLLILETESQQRVLVSSFDHGFLRRLHQLDPDIQLGALYVPVRDLTKRPSSIARRVGATAFTCSIAKINKRLAGDAHANNITLGCYRVNTATQLEKALKFGVKMIITDHPKQIRKLLK